jgi:hypothetical protein
MKKLLLISVLLSLSLGSAHAQLSSTIIKRIHDQSFSMGRDFWFAMPSNGWGGSNPLHEIFISSPRSTTAYVELGSTRSNIDLQANQITIFTVPVSWEMESSGIVESKAIHVYCNDADLSVCFLSQTYTGAEGTCIIPTIGWGSDYVVAAFASLFEGSGSSYYDYPSECVIVANEDNTVVNITPPCDCRSSTTGNENGNADASIVAFPAGKTFTVQMDRGESLELMPVLATGPDNFDLTGTIIHTNKPIGVIGGSSETNIPLDIPYANFVCEMIPPLRTWGETYCATAFTGQPNGNALYLFVASEAGQTIMRHDCASGDHIECVISNQYGIYWDEIGGAEKFTSSAPFLVVSYINNAGSGNGSPAEVEINPREQYTKSETFQVLQPPSNHIGFTDYANIVVNDSDEKKTIFDGKPIIGNAKQCIDGNWEVFVISNISQGIHTVMGDDSGVGIYVYGNRSGESYAWSSPEFEGTFPTSDSSAPFVNSNIECYQALIHVVDSGTLPNSLGKQSGLAEIRLDSILNMAYSLDSDFIDGAGSDTTSYNLSVIDLTKPAILIVTAFDLAGNSTTITSTYSPEIVTMEPPIQNLGVWSVGTPPTVAYDTLYNLGQDTITLTELQLKYGNVGFSIYDSAGGAVDLSPLLPGHRRLIQIQFVPQKSTAAIDSIIYGNNCELQAVAVIGSGGAADFTVTSQTWPNEPLGNCYPKTVYIENLSKGSITIDSEWWSDTQHFRADPSNGFPLTIPPSPGKTAFIIDYCPDSNSVLRPDRTQGAWFSPQVLKPDGSGTQDPRFDSLIGWATAPLSVEGENIPSLSATIITIEGGRSLEIVLPEDVDAPIHFELVNVLGQSVLQSTLGTGTQNIDASSLPRGVYFYRLTSGQMNQNGKLILGQ